MKRLIAILSALFFTLTASAQQSVNALFIGNSYTEVNDLPQMISNIADNMGDHLTYQRNTPGGCTFSQHCNNQSMTLIRSGGWDIVVLQEQSQYPSFPQVQVENEVFPYAERLVDSIYANSPCAEPMFYMTWGRKNGDQNNAQYFPILGTYEGMDSMLYERYMYMADVNDASVCPVGRVWRWLRENSDIELYQSDESHPSVAGTYAAACAFYTMIFLRDPSLITYKPDAISEIDAQTIRNAAHNIVYTEISNWKRKKPKSGFRIETIIGNDVILTHNASQADTIIWDFGDGTTMTLPANVCQTSTTHSYAASGSYIITLTASRHCMIDTSQQTVQINVAQDSTGIESPHNNGTLQFTLYPNPATDRITVKQSSHDNNAQPYKLIILTDDGKTMAFHNIYSALSTIDISYLAAGQYIFRIETPSDTYIHKVVKH